MESGEITDTKTRAVYERLVTTYGERDLTPRRDPMHELISTILSQRTTWANEELAYKRMWERLFCFSKPILPVDTHVYRVSQRVGLISQKVKSSTAAHKPLAELLPEEPHVLYNFHIALLLHGQRVCVWKAPQCERCPLTDVCEWYAENRTQRWLS